MEDVINFKILSVFKEEHAFPNMNPPPMNGKGCSAKEGTWLGGRQRAMNLELREPAPRKDRSKRYEGVVALQSFLLISVTALPVSQKVHCDQIAYFFRGLDFAALNLGVFLDSDF